MYVDTFIFFQFNNTVEAGFPVAISGEIVIGQKEGVDTYGMILPNNAFDIICGAETAFLSLYIDDGAKRAVEGAAASQVENRIAFCCFRDVGFG